MHKALKAERGKMEPHLWCSRDGESGFVEVLTEGKMVICFSKNEQKPNQMGEEKHIPGRAPPPQQNMAASKALPQLAWWLDF